MPMRNSVDRDVYQIISKLEDEVGASRMTVSLVYDAIKRSNSSLARQKKRPLEDAIERVLDRRAAERRADEDAEDSDEALERQIVEAEEARTAAAHSRDPFLLNRQITKHWKFSSASLGAEGPANGTAVAPTSRSAGKRSQPDSVADAEGLAGNERLPSGEAKPKRRKADRQKENDRSPPKGISITDMAGVDQVLDKLLDPIWLPLRRGAAFEKLGYRFNDGVLLHGPSGCGKTTLATALAASLGVAYIPVSAPSLVGGTSGESEKNIRELFDEAIRLAPCLMFVDELDSIAGKRDSAGKAMEGRMVAELNAGMDKIAQRGADEAGGKNVVVLAATNRPDAIEPVIRRRFSVEIDMGMPNEPARQQILRSMTRGMALADDVDFAELARLTPGYVGADLRYVVTAAVYRAMHADMAGLIERAAAKSQPEPVRGPEQESGPGQEIELEKKKKDASVAMTPSMRKWLLLESARDDPVGDICITQTHLKAAIASVQPAARREGFSTIPDTTWAHVGALGDVRKKLEMTIIGPIKYPERFARVGIKSAAGILLWGPPGCGKTLVAKAVANESKANFISIKGPELLNKFVGESERAVRQLFARARSSAPCILFFDEMDALVPRRDDSLSDASARVVNTLLTELDGVGDRSGIYVVGATNRPDIIDPAIRRPGRLGTSIFVGLPAPADRVDILRTIYRNTIVRGASSSSGGDDDPAVAARLERIALDPRCDGFSGADLGNLMQAAAQASLERTVYYGGGGMAGGPGAVEEDEAAPAAETSEPQISGEDWEKALQEVKPSVKDIHRYDELRT